MRAPNHGSAAPVRLTDHYLTQSRRRWYTMLKPMPFDENPVLEELLTQADQSLSLTKTYQLEQATRRFKKIEELGSIVFRKF